MFRSLLIRALPLLSLTQVVAQADGAGGAGTGQGIGSVATTITSQLAAVGKLVIGVAQVAGLVFMAAGLFKLKQHKDNPQQIPIGTPLTMLVIGACLAFLPSLVDTGGATLFADGGKKGGFTGQGFQDGAADAGGAADAAGRPG
jgi:intracellular multiplication protein IcmD